jgi:hypothetical protein
VKVQGFIEVLIFGLLITLAGFGYRRYISKNENDFDTPLGKLYGISMVIICSGILIILLALTMNADEVWG